LGHAFADRIGALYLLAAYRRRGIGKAMLGRLLHALHERGIRQARFDVVAANSEAVAFYRAQGARPLGRCANRDARGDTEDLIFAIATAKAGGCASVP
jgi:ribosomal protein S18 acetylase RimI-like enzyme